MKTKSPKKKEEPVAIAEKKVAKKNVTIIPRTEFMGTANSRNPTFLRELSIISKSVYFQAMPFTERER